MKINKLFFMFAIVAMVALSAFTSDTVKEKKEVKKEIVNGPTKATPILSILAEYKFKFEGVKLVAKIPTLNFKAVTTQISLMDEGCQYVFSGGSWYYCCQFGPTINCFPRVPGPEDTE